MHPESQRFYEILDELKELHARKQADYGREDSPFANVRGSEDFGIPAWVGAMVRASDKVRRLQRLARDGRLDNETAIDSFRDLAVYAIIAEILYEETVAMPEEFDHIKEIRDFGYVMADVSWFDNAGDTVFAVMKDGSRVQLDEKSLRATGKQLDTPPKAISPE
jgi:hypothetical protein